ncbi:hypothetical protein J3F83DRAFT_199941 [Trichoderma novae-zelandiae]
MHGVGHDGPGEWKPRGVLRRCPVGGNDMCDMRAHAMKCLYDQTDFNSKVQHPTLSVCTISEDHQLISYHIIPLHHRIRIRPPLGSPLRLLVPPFHSILIVNDASTTSAYSDSPDTGEGSRGGPPRSSKKDQGTVVRCVSADEWGDNVDISPYAYLLFFFLLFLLLLHLFPLFFLSPFDRDQSPRFRGPRASVAQWLGTHSGLSTCRRMGRIRGSTCASWQIQGRGMGGVLGLGGGIP